MIKPSILKLAILQAQKAISLNPKRKVYRHGSVLFSGKRILNCGRNFMSKTHPKSNSEWGKIHAELDCILGVARDILENSNLLVIRLSAFGDLVMSRPCPNCMDLIRAANIKNIFYSNNQGQIVKERI